jgi:enamine deaminase RidA (YjgF/YER057c/UK114 family)
VRTCISSANPYEDVFGYSRAVRVGGTIHVSGTTARPPESSGDAYVQARAALSIIERALREAGAELAAVVRTVTYVTDIADADLVARAHREAFADVRPAATMVEVSALVSPELRVEIEAYAQLDADTATT